MAKNSRTPSIRFKGFTDAWEQRKLGDVVKITMGQSPDGSTYSDTPTKYILVQGNADLVDGWVSPRMWTTQITKQAEAGDLIMSVRAPAGSMGKTAYNVVLGRGVAGIKGNEYIFQLLVKKDTDGYWKTLSAGSTFESINSNSVVNAEIALPCESEQQKIGAYFEKLDNIITLYQRKYEKFVNIKKALLEKMFPQGDEKVPRIRFKGFTGAWEQRKLGDIGRVAMNRRIFKEQTSVSGEVPFFKIGTFGGEPDAFISDELYQVYKEQYPYPQIGDILLSASGSIGKMVEYKGEKAYFQDSNIVWLEHDTSVSNSFLKCFYAVVKWAGLEGSTIKRLYNKNILETQISLPSYKEQLLIGLFFEQLDNLITLHQRQVEKLKNIKSALLANMFI
mgnify:CR=1 FL=1